MYLKQRLFNSLFFYFFDVVGPAHKKTCAVIPKILFRGI